MGRRTTKTSGWTRIRRSSYGSKDEWKELSDSVKREANYTCCKCGRHRTTLHALGLQLHADHIRRLADGGTSSKRNLRSICSECHSKLPGHKHMKKKGGARKRPFRARKWS